MGNQAESHFQKLNGLRLHYVEWGDPSATPMVLLHGLRAYAHWFDAFAEAVKDRYRVLALDQRGRGDSDRAPDGDYTREAYVRDLEAFVDALGLERFIILGHSMGGLNGIHYASRHPERVIALINVDVGPDIDPAGLERIRKELGETPDSFASWEDAAAFLVKRHPRASEEHRAIRLRWMFRESPDGTIAWRIDPAIFDPNLRADSRDETWAAWKGLGCPTLIVRGGVTDILTEETCEEMVAALPNSRWVEVPEAGHMVLEDNPEGFNAASLAFLQTLEGGSN
ncbi:MAG: alpha/beta hydrolase [Myxococcales bacterium]|nr:alpha/beta hydrolase [Myxococcales bacterium]